MIVNIVMLLTYEVCVLFVDNVKAKVFKEYSAGFPCYSLLPSLRPRNIIQGRYAQ